MSDEEGAGAMSPDKATLEDLTGYLGIGALELLGFFFVLDGASGFLVFLETYAKTTSWAILVTVPILVVSYILGLISSLIVESAVRLKPILTPDLFARVTASKNETLIRRFAEVERHTRLLNGCLVAFVLLAAGSLAEVRMMGSFGFVGSLGMILGLLLAAICPISCPLRSRVSTCYRAVLP